MRNLGVGDYVICTLDKDNDDYFKGYKKVS